MDGSSSSGASSEEDDEDEEQPRPRGAPPKAAGADFESWPQLVAVAKAHMQSGKFEKAVNEYSDLLKRSSLAGGTGGDPTARARHAALLLARSAAFAALSRQLRGIPAAQVRCWRQSTAGWATPNPCPSCRPPAAESPGHASTIPSPPTPLSPPPARPQSERRAIFAPDPCQLAALGLKDAEAAAALQDGCPEAQLHRGDCLALLERYTAAEAAYKTGLGYQPTHEALQRQLAQLRALLDGGSTKEGDTGDGRGGGEARQQGAGRSVRDAAEDAECTLCFKLYYEPVTTPCGHTFCK